MRFTYMVLMGILFFLVGRWKGEVPPVGLMQGVIAVTGLLLLGRLLCVMRFPENPAEEKVRLDWRRALGICVRIDPLAAACRKRYGRRRARAMASAAKARSSRVWADITEARRRAAPRATVG